MKESDKLPESKLDKDLKTLKSSYGLLAVAERDCKQMKKFVQQWKHEGLYKHFSPSWEEFVQKEMGVSVGFIDIIVAAANVLEKYEDRKNGGDVN